MSVGFGLRFVPSDELETELLEDLSEGWYTAQEVEDVLRARELLHGALEQIDANYRGFVGSTIDGTLVYGDDMQAIIAALDTANPVDRLGFASWIEPQPV